MELNFLIVEDQHIRFCQQCGRFQLLSEFDGDKRSCRRKLAQHNVRRRRQERDSPALSETFSSDETNDNKRMRSLVGEYAAGNPVLMQKQQQLQHILSILLNKNPQQQIPREPKSGPYPGRFFFSFFLDFHYVFYVIRTRMYVHVWGYDYTILYVN